ncbi:Glycosyltransferase, catalytic subunit of cellulose synthase and poly-beta-1,6-N-acetylglucosamine synthase [Hyphomicrobiales bacterium]|nr:Glycosyltransferase, catalytic subunit of cellulose synthase and poly-beta-1,6-N-acetylglucosamine synthase [Hyphomicrobiales bacterium]CAH1698028.1 Glycosyltransferase, catalytic subunit of cellulose synthase and poly-beta-1,6-N-acetylglucosamine synthase [Hyphomicrobiales bacterium]CAI0347671.1 glycosyltransferase XagB [Hyphomicrobiales bacterium]
MEGSGQSDGKRAGSLPVEIAFLTRQGVAPAALALAAEQARRSGTEPAREVIALGLIDEAGFYRGLAAELDMPFRESPPPLRAGGSYEAILQAGIAPTMADPDFRFVLAPEGPTLRRMLEAGPRQRSDIAVTTPRNFAAALRSANAAELAHRLAGTDETGLARDSAREGASRGQKIAAGIGLSAAALGGVFAPLESFFACALLLGPIFLGLILLRLATAIERATPDLWLQHRWRIDDARLPVYTVAVPIYREEAVLQQLADALSALDYPPAKLDIRLLVEAEDTGTRSALNGMTLPPHFTVTVVPPGLPRTKPRALNLALLEARGSLFTIFDAEDIPDPQQLRMAAARFLRGPPELGCLQARLVIDHAQEKLLTGLFALEYAGLFEVLNPGLLKFQLPIMLGGTSNHFRTQALHAVGGWDAWNVTEDADLGLRLVRAGHRIGDLPSATREEAPLSIPAWLKQRSRWIKGYIQTLVTHSRAPIRLLHEAGFGATFVFLSLAFGTVAAALGFPIFAVAALLAYWDGALFEPAGALATLGSTVAFGIWLFGSVALFVPPAIGALRRGSPGLLPLLLLLPFYCGLISIAAWMAVYEYVNRRFVWNKTEHGLARQRAPVERSKPRPDRPDPP